MIVSGKITDSYGALDGATIVLLRDGKRTNLATISNQEGKFEIENNENFKNYSLNEKTDIYFSLGKEIGRAHV